MDPVATISWIVCFVVVTVAVTGLSGRVGWSAPIVLVTVGVAVSFIPAVPAIELQPEFVLYGILPPLLYAAAIRTSFVDVRARRDGILLLSVGLVTFTVVAVGFVTWWIVPSITLAAAFAFGAVVAPTDAVAVSAMAGRIGLPRRLVTVLEGESLLNDATALVALNAAIAAILSTVTPWMVVGDFGLAVGGGLAVGLGVAFILSMIRKRLRAPVLDTSLSLVTPYVAFIPAQLIHGSGVLAVVVAGLYLGYRSPVIQTAEARIAETLNWRTIQFLLENAVFLFIGLAASGILKGVATTGPGPWQTAGIAVVILLALFLSRALWMLLSTTVYRFGPEWLRQRGWSWRTGAAVSFAGVRGVVTLAAVFLLPEATPGRAYLQFLALVVVVGTLLQGLTLPWIIRLLHLPAPNWRQEMDETHRLLAEAQTAGLTRLDEELVDTEVEERVLVRLRTNARFLSDALEAPSPEDSEPVLTAYNRLRRSMIRAEREAVITARSEGRYQELSVRAALAAIDLEETALKVNKPRRPGSNLT
ncbi:MAG: Na+/H+ antiporter [Glaciihabitans sp.]|nr:Na+/H+ antiporter [Glaciihabitans sp.]